MPFIMMPTKKQKADALIVAKKFKSMSVDEILSLISQVVDPKPVIEMSRALQIVKIQLPKA